MSAGSEYAQPETKGVALNDVSVAQVRNAPAEELQALVQAFFPDTEKIVNKSDLSDYLKQQMKNGLVVGATLNSGQDSRLIGAFLLGQDSHDTRATTLSYGRINEAKKGSKGAMTAAGLKVTETLLRRGGILDRGKRKELRSSGEWESQRSVQESQLAAHPIRAYVDINNIASQKMLERMGYVRTGMVEDGNKEYVYELKLDNFDDAIDNFGNPMRNLQ